MTSIQSPAHFLDTLSALAHSNKPTTALLRDATEAHPSMKKVWLSTAEMGLDQNKTIVVVNNVPRERDALGVIQTTYRPVSADDVHGS